ncbi:hypothetical protein EN794_034775 [Mesorhizobium sp. M00.F.Ca.ET.151.01.1.1]|nr:hypothetical protein EN842_25530 [bacterium M00.F.Ca.ET.199.01.1.1]TGT01733.1 hypothetical protein EN820_29665 [bacterium M00.F.Ca.ET.177.01.1.1]TGT59077.1 hypothetical protein EN813_030220 [Mesorhizobium sp. M00.F.Ca.ET.170.01.1.1]TGU11103.1 hypothetical protein EN806_24940 [bacterium M00.F.Ca.ET.163.01.1.1]TGU92743.1 hypothetical protein EN794_034775 [Mesorhizobium sp. M00.F.Ca.ET.151.01.1.1]TGV54701.1 hypothetical protein EN784_34300 [bacterium M00.F.Ca.ET.141.01.1.1]
MFYYSVEREYFFAEFMHQNQNHNVSQRIVFWFEFDVRDKAGSRFRALICAVSLHPSEATGKGESWLRRKGYREIQLRMCKRSPTFRVSAAIPIEATLLKSALKRGAAGHVRPFLQVEAHEIATP